MLAQSSAMQINRNMRCIEIGGAYKDNENNAGLIET